jgi:hypothetical protein
VLLEVTQILQDGTLDTRILLGLEVVQKLPLHVDELLSLLNTHPMGKILTEIQLCVYLECSWLVFITEYLTIQKLEVVLEHGDYARFE